MDIKDAIIQSVMEVFPLYLMDPQFKGEEERDVCQPAIMSMY